MFKGMSKGLSIIRVLKKCMHLKQFELAEEIESENSFSNKPLKLVKKMADELPDD